MEDTSDPNSPTLLPPDHPRPDLGSESDGRKEQVYGRLPREGSVLIYPSLETDLRGHRGSRGPSHSGVKESGGKDQKAPVSYRCGYTGWIETGEQWRVWKGRL